MVFRSCSGAHVCGWGGSAWDLAEGWRQSNLELLLQLVITIASR